MDYSVLLHIIHQAELLAGNKFIAPQVFDPEFRKQFPSVERYFVTLARQPKFSAVVGSDVQLCSEPPKGELRIPHS